MLVVLEHTRKIRLWEACSILQQLQYLVCLLHAA